MTGLEGMSDDLRLASVPDFIYYPRELRLRVYPRASLGDFPAPIKDKYGISSWWLLDGGSVLPVLALDLNADDKVLDMCAAPGGKSLLIAQTKRFGRGKYFWANSVKIFQFVCKILQDICNFARLSLSHLQRLKASAARSVEARFGYVHTQRLRGGEQNHHSTKGCLVGGSMGRVGRLR